MLYLLDCALTNKIDFEIWGIPTYLRLWLLSPNLLPPNAKILVKNTFLIY